MVSKNRLLELAKPHFEQTDQTLNTLVELGFQGQTAFVVLSAQFVDDLLKILIVSRMPKLSKTKEEKLFHGYGPFNSFSVKIDIAHAMDIIDEGLRHDLDVLRKIRNKFAHPTGPVDFRSTDIRKLVAGFRDHDKKMDSYLYFLKKIEAIRKSLEPKMTTSALVDTLRSAPSEKSGTLNKKS